MKTLVPKNREIWELLFRTGEQLTASEVAARVGVDSMVAFWGLQNMARRSLIKVKPNPSTRWLNYCVDGTCMIPRGMSIAEVQE